jgi:hypothetical protein
MEGIMNVLGDYEFGMLTGDEHFEFHSAFHALLGGFGEIRKIVKMNFELHAVELAKEEVEKVALDGGALEKIRKENRLRYEVYEGLKGIVEAHRRDFEKFRRDAAGLVWDIFSKYKSIRDYEYEMKTDEFNKLVKELETGVVVENVETLRVHDWVKELKNRNEKFDALVWGVEYSRKVADNARLFRYEVTKLYWKMVQGIFHTGRNRKVDGFENFVIENDKLVEKWLRVVEARRGVVINRADVKREIFGWIG